MIDNTKVETMLKNGIHFGYSKSRRHPSTKDFVFGSKNGSDMIDIEKVDEQITKAEEIMKSFAVGEHVILFVGAKPEAKKVALESAESIAMPFVINRWIGGALTNFQEIKKRINRLADLKKAKETGDLLKYTKKEQLLLSREVAKLEINFGGLAGVTKKPDLLVIFDTKKERIAHDEAISLGIPVIGIANTDCDISKITYPIVANDAGKASLDYIAKRLIESYKSARG